MSEVDFAAARQLWLNLETVHAVTYFADESRAAAVKAGLKGFWMGYFGFRAAPMGAATASSVTEAFYNFAPHMVGRAIPDAWTYAVPADLLAVRSAAAAATLRRIAPSIDAVAEVCLGQLESIVTSEVEATGPLAESNAATTRLEDPVERLWQLATFLREHRGDAHVSALRARAIDGCGAHVLRTAGGDIDPARLRESRGWSEEDWRDAEHRLTARDILADGSRTALAHRIIDEIAAETDSATAQLIAAAGIDPISMNDALRGVALTIARAGVIPYPNPIGLPDISASS